MSWYYFYISILQLHVDVDPTCDILFSLSWHRRISLQNKGSDWVYSGCCLLGRERPGCR